MVDVDLSPRDILSLYTDMDNVHDYIGSTRSVIIHQPLNDDNNVVIIDGLQFVMFISIPDFVNPIRLRKFMTNAYLYSHYIEPIQEEKEKDETEGDKKWSYYKKTNTGGGAVINHLNPMMIPGYIKPQEEESTKKRTYQKGMFSMEEHNDKVDNHTKNLLSRIDLKNTRNFKDYKSRMPTIFIDDIFVGLPKEGDDANDEIMQKYMYSMPFSEREVQKKFPDQTQYKLVFNNHLILLYFLNRFLNKDITFEYDPTPKFRVNIIAYISDVNNCTDIKPANMPFKDKPVKYLEGQLYKFKNNNDLHPLHFNDAEEMAHYGLLHPSCTENFACKQYANTFPNMRDSIKGITTEVSFFTFSYQTLYINLSSLAMSNLTIKKVHFGDRKRVLLTHKKPILPLNNNTTKKKKPSTKPVKKQPKERKNFVKLDKFFTPHVVVTGQKRDLEESNDINDNGYMDSDYYKKRKLDITEEM